jgi:hypothetical protein
MNEVMQSAERATLALFCGGGILFLALLITWICLRVEEKAGQRGGYYQK